MNHNSGSRGLDSEKLIRTIKRKTRRQYGAEEKIRIVLDGLRGEETIAELCRREGLAQSIYYKWSKEFLEAGKRRLAGDTARSASTGEVKSLRRDVWLHNKTLSATATTNHTVFQSTIWGVLSQPVASSFHAPGCELL